MIKSIQGKDKIFFGVDKGTKERIFISKPEFSCNWYWSFGHLGNKNCHYHLDGYQSKGHAFKLEDGSFKVLTEKRNINMYDALLADYDLAPAIQENLWRFCELAKTIYTLKETAEVFHRGGSHYTTNPCKGILQDEPLYNKLTFDLIPNTCQAFWELIGGNA